MKRCPTCNRTYPDDNMTNCAHDGTPLMAAAYSPPYGAPPPAQQGYVAPPPPGYPPPHPGWQPGAGAGQFAPCPSCRRPDAEQMKFTWWGGVLGPKLFTHVKCKGCGTAYNGKTGQSNTTNIVIYSVVLGAVAFVVFFLIFNSMR